MYFNVLRIGITCKRIDAMALHVQVILANHHRGHAITTSDGVAA